MNRELHQTRREILYRLSRNPEFLSLDSRNTLLAADPRRADKTKRQVAWLCVIAAWIILAVAIGCLLCSANSPLLSALAVNILIAGFWGRHYLKTHR